MQLTNLKYFQFIFRAFLTAAILSACAVKKDGESPSTNPQTTTPVVDDGSQTLAQLAGYGYTCGLFTSGAGTTLNGKAYDRYISLNADGTYSYSFHITNATACLAGHPTGSGSSVVAAQLNVGGTFAVGGTNITPSTATKVTLTPTSQRLTIYSPGTNATALDIANWANANCNTFDAAFSTSSASSGANIQSGNCTTNGLVFLGTPPVITTGQNIFYRTTNYQTGTPLSIWSPDAGSYPSAYTTIWQ